MKRILATDSKNIPALIARVAAAVAIFPHGAQKLFGWFGGLGLAGTFDVFTNAMGIPWLLVLLVIIVESAGSVFLFLGLGTRLAALSIAFNFIGVLIVDIWGNGFFMNWGGAEGQGEGLEYFVLLFGLLVISLIAGGGKASLDARLHPEI